MRIAPLALLLVVAACDERASPRLDARWFAAESWNDGAAVVSVYRGRRQRYGQWRVAEVRDYVIREYLDPAELTKRDREDEALLPVVKANRHVAFNTGTYDYRLMASLFFDRRDGSLVKATASSQDGCGLVYQRWDRNSRRHRWDSYWEGEGVGSRELALGAREFFADEIGFIAHLLPAGGKISVRPALDANRASTGPAVERTVERSGRVTRLAAGGRTVAEYEHDADGFLLRWKIDGAEEFERVTKKRLYYWQRTDPADRGLLEGK